MFRLREPVARELVEFKRRMKCIEPARARHFRVFQVHDHHRLPDVMIRLASRASKDFSIHSESVTMLKGSADIATDLEARCENILHNHYPSEDEDVFRAA